MYIYKHYKLNMFSQNSYVETLISAVMILEAGIIWKLIDLDEVRGI